MRSEASAISTLSAVSMKCQMRPSARFTSSSSSSMVSSLLRCSWATPSICSSTTFTRARMLPSVRTLERILPTTSSSKRRALSLGVFAGILAALHDRLADVVGELPALGVLSAQRPVAGLALDQSAEQVGACDSPGVGDLGCPGAHQAVDPAEAGLGDDGRKRLLHPHRLGLVLRLGAPDQRARVDLVLEDEVDGVLGPELACGAGDTLVVEGLSDGQDVLDATAT